MFCKKFIFCQNFIFSSKFHFLSKFQFCIKISFFSKFNFFIKLSFFLLNFFHILFEWNFQGRLSDWKLMNYGILLKIRYFLCFLGQDLRQFFCVWFRNSAENKYFFSKYTVLSKNFLLLNTNQIFLEICQKTI
mgnify:CR=1 FL=1